jgi:hypothetical protein
LYQLLDLDAMMGVDNELPEVIIITAPDPVEDIHISTDVDNTKGPVKKRGKGKHKRY